jgi:hypothetical protein
MCDHVNLQGEQIVDVVHLLEQQSQPGSQPKPYNGTAPGK